jgi:hypothetical protein
MELEDCKYFQNNISCQNISYCNDLFNILNKLAPHFEKIRFLLRKLYELRSINIWLLRIDNILEEGTFREIELFLNNKRNVKVNAF